eukprot:26445-Pelagomonas_calceolata.AAC.1
MDRHQEWMTPSYPDIRKGRLSFQQGILMPATLPFILVGRRAMRLFAQVASFERCRREHMARPCRL